MTWLVSFSISRRFGPRPRHDTITQRRPPLPELDQAGRQRAAASVGVQVVPGRQQPRGRVGDGKGRMRRDVGEQAREGQ